MASPSKRRDMDIMKVMMSGYTVEIINDGINEFNVEFHGPKESLYEAGVWKLRVELPDAYPFKSPYIGFLNKILHPNVDEMACAYGRFTLNLHRWFGEACHCQPRVQGLRFHRLGSPSLLSDMPVYSLDFSYSNGGVTNSWTHWTPFQPEAF